MKNFSALFSVFCSFIGLAHGQAPVEHVVHTFGNFTHGATPYGTLARDTSGNLYGTTYLGGTANMGVVFKLHAGAYQTLHSFLGGSDGANPYAGVTLDNSGNVYGTTYLGGVANVGTVYKINAAGQETVIYAFSGQVDGANPYASLTIDSAGNVYGTTVYGGANNAGVVFKISPVGQETTLYSFKGKADGASPYGWLIFDPSGNLYGTTYGGGQHGKGVIYELNNSFQETVLYSFDSRNGSPHAGLTRDSAGNYYGTTSSIIYEFSATNQFTTLYQFAIGEGPQDPDSGVVLDTAGNIYGTTDGGGVPLRGIVYKLDTAGALTSLYAFPGGPGYQVPTGGIILDPSGQIFGTTPNAGSAGMVYQMDASGKERTLYTFPGAADGTTPFGSLIMDAKGNLYGTTQKGGPTNSGVLYKIDPSGKETTLYDFTGTPGAGPGHIIARDSKGDIYGAADTGADGFGSLFKLSASGAYTTIYNFTGGPDGTGSDGVTLDSAGNLYGAGTGGLAPSGLIFKIATSGIFSVLYTFTGGADGSDPNPELTIDASGNIYGTTVYGGSGAGVVFEITNQTAFRTLYTFTDGTDGGNPTAGVVLDPAGALYGTTSNGVPNGGRVFKISAAGEYGVLYSFTNILDGELPLSSVVLDPTGNLYGTTSIGGATGCTYACGVVYELDTSGQETVLHSFTDGAGGGYPYSNVILSPSGNLYGTAVFGGTTGGGVLYKITPQ